MGRRREAHAVQSISMDVNSDRLLSDVVRLAYIDRYILSARRLTSQQPRSAAICYRTMSLCNETMPTGC